ncbi:MAG: DUF4271 domain-containing protein [Paludibacter sp.]
MNQPDTLHIAKDSLTAMTDSTAIADSIAKADSLHLADSLRIIAQIPRGFLGITHPSMPQTESWVFIILILLFFLFVYSISQSMGLISDTIKTFFHVKDRSSIFSKATVNDSRFRFFLIIFSIGSLSLYAYLILHNPMQPFSLKEFCLFLFSTSIFFGIKSLLFDLIGYVFINTGNLKIAKGAYFNIISFWGVCLFPILFLQIYIPDNFIGITQLLSLIVSISAGILIIIKLFQIFFQKILASFYILLYLCTLEILPLIILFKVYKLIV